MQITNTFSGASPHAGEPIPLLPATIEVVPNHALDADPPLSSADLQMRFGHPVKADGVDYSKHARLYAQKMGDVRADRAFCEWDKRPLCEFQTEANTATFSYLVRLLALRDAAKRDGIGLEDFHRELHQKHGYRGALRTLHRQTDHARLALMLAGKGLIDRLPSQNVSAVICAQLPSDAWANFVRDFPVTDCGAEACKKRIQKFAAKTQTLLRGQPVARRLTCAQPKEDSTPAALPPPEPAHPEARQKSVPRKRVAEKLARRLAGLIPDYHLGDPAAVAAALMSHFDGRMKVSRPGRHERLKGLLAAIKEIDPPRAAAFVEAAKLRALAAVVDAAVGKPEATKKDSESTLP